MLKLNEQEFGKYNQGWKLNLKFNFLGAVNLPKVSSNENIQEQRQQSH